MAKQSPAQKETVARVMHEFKHGGLETRDGEPVENPRQAIAIALHEAGGTNQETPARNRRNLARTKRKERAGKTARADAKGGAKPRSRPDAGESRNALYAEAKRRNIQGRSKMGKADLERALAGHGGSPSGNARDDRASPG